MDTPSAIARDMLDQISRTQALLCLAKLCLTASSPRRSWNALRLMMAVVVA